MPRPLDPELWEKNFQLLVHYQSENNTNTHTHTNNRDAPNTSEPGVGKWVSHQRSNYRAGTLSIERIAKLNSIDFVWDCQKKAKATATAAATATATAMLQLLPTKVPTPSKSKCSTSTTTTSVTKSTIARTESSLSLSKEVATKHNTPVTTTTTTTMTMTADDDDDANYGTIVGLGGQVLRYKKSGEGEHVVMGVGNFRKSLDTTTHKNTAAAAATTMLTMVGVPVVGKLKDSSSSETTMHKKKTAAATTTTTTTTTTTKTTTNMPTMMTTGNYEMKKIKGWHKTVTKDVVQTEYDALPTQSSRSQNTLAELLNIPQRTLSTWIQNGSIIENEKKVDTVVAATTTSTIIIPADVVDEKERADSDTKKISSTMPSHSIMSSSIAAQKTETRSSPSSSSPQTKCAAPLKKKKEFDALDLDTSSSIVVSTTMDINKSSNKRDRQEKDSEVRAPPIKESSSPKKKKPRGTMRMEAWDTNFTLYKKYHKIEHALLVNDDNNNNDTNKEDSLQVLPHDKGIRRWIQFQRQQHRKGRLSDERIQRLTAVGFDWESSKDKKPDKTWEQNFELLKAYKLAHNGSTMVPTKHSELGCWVGHQRCNYKKQTKQKLSDSRTQQLNSIDFDWEVTSRRKSKTTAKVVSSCVVDDNDNDNDKMLVAMI